MHLRMAWLGRSLRWARTPPTRPVWPGPIQSGLEHLQHLHLHGFSGQPVQFLTTVGVKNFFLTEIFPFSV